MKKDDIDKATTLAFQWKQAEDEKVKEQIRNEIYFLTKPALERWILAILASKKIYYRPDEIISKGWDCFEFALKHFKPENPIPFPNHFYSYSKFFIQSEIQKEELLKKKELIMPPDEIGSHMRGVFGEAGDMKYAFQDYSGNKNDNLTIDDSLSSIYHHIEELKTFRSLLPEGYNMIFDDALLSLSPNNRDKVVRRPKGFGDLKYREAKKIFKIIIEFLLMR